MDKMHASHNNRNNMLTIILRYNISGLQKMPSLQCEKESHKASGCRVHFT